MRHAETKENNRRALIAAAISEIAENGYQDARVAEIAARAGLTTGAVYSGFGGKRELLIAATRQLVEQFHDTVRPMVADSELDLEGVLRGYVDAMLGTAADSPALERFTFELAALTAALRDPKLMAELDAEVPQGLPLLTELFTGRRIAPGAPERTTPEQAARLAPAVEALLSGYAQRGITVRAYVDREYVLESAIALIALLADRRVTPARPPR